MKRILLCVLLWVCCANGMAAEAISSPPPSACTARVPALCPVADRPGLPRVLLVGDSISIGYTLPVRGFLDGVANVHRIPENGGSTRKGLRNIDEWLPANEKWDVIHVNFGLHDAQIGPDGVPQVDLDTYAKNVKTLIERLKSAGAKVIWATTTPVPPDVAKHKWSDVTAYNRVALKVAQEEGCAIDDLYAVALPKEKDLQLPQNVHYKKAGSELLGHAVADSISALLKKQ